MAEGLKRMGGNGRASAELMESPGVDQGHRDGCPREVKLWEV